MYIRQFDGKPTYRVIDSYIYDEKTQEYSDVVNKLKVGAIAKFKPMEGLRMNDPELTNKEVNGVITMINTAHKWFQVEYGRNPVIRTSFNFADIGCTVDIL